MVDFEAENDERRKTNEVISFGDVGSAAPGTVLVSGRARSSTSQVNPGDFVDYQNVTRVVWLGMPPFALLGAVLLLWRTHRRLARVRRDHRVAQAALPAATSPTPITTAVG